MTSTPWVASGLPLNATNRTPLHASPSSGNIHGLSASRTASRSERPTARWSAWFQLGPPQESRWLIDKTTSGRWRRIVPKVVAEVEPFDDRAVGALQELHIGDADHGTARDLLGAPDRPDLSGRHRRDAGLAVGHQDVADPLPLAGPAGHGGRRSVLHVIGMGDHGQGSGPVLRQNLQIGRVASVPGVSRATFQDSATCARVAMCSDDRRGRGRPGRSVRNRHGTTIDRTRRRTVGLRRCAFHATRRGAAAG